MPDTKRARTSLVARRNISSFLPALQPLQMIEPGLVMFVLLQVHRIIFIIPLIFNGGHDQSFRNDDVLGAQDINNNTIYSNVGGRESSLLELVLTWNGVVL